METSKLLNLDSLISHSNAICDTSIVLAQRLNFKLNTLWVEFEELESCLEQFITPEESVLVEDLERRIRGLLDLSQELESKIVVVKRQLVQLDQAL